MKNPGRWFPVVLAAVLLARPGIAGADVVPVRKAKSTEDAAKVEARLVSLGLSGNEASACVGSLTAAELVYFAEDPARVQSVGGLTASEWITGGAVLVLTGVIYFAFVSNGNNP